MRPLTNAGAFVFGKLNMHELSYGITSNNRHTGAVRNPHDPQRIPGDSSGGAGAAVAAGLAPAALGTDTGGSVRIPAALCGGVGFRPTTGRYSQAGIVPISHTRDTAGPLCRSVDDVALLDAVIAGEADALPELPPSGPRIGVPRQYFLDETASETRAVFEARLDDLRTDGWTLVDVDILGIERPEDGCGFLIALYETRSGLTRYLADHAPGGPGFDALAAAVASPDVRGLFAGMTEAGQQEMAGPYRAAIETRRPKLQALFADCFAANRLDALVFPTTVLPAARIGEDETTEIDGKTVPTFAAFIRNTDPGSTAGIPSITLPAGTTPQGLPVGLALDGPAGSDRRLLAVAAAIEGTLPPPHRPGA